MKNIRIELGDQQKQATEGQQTPSSLYTFSNSLTVRYVPMGLI